MLQQLLLYHGHTVVEARDGREGLQLFQHSNPDLVITDPPYNVDYEGYTEDKLTIKGDHMSPEQFTAFYRQAQIGDMDVISVIGLDGITRARRTASSAPPWRSGWCCLERSR